MHAKYFDIFDVTLYYDAGCTKFLNDAILLAVKKHIVLKVISHISGGNATLYSPNQRRVPVVAHITCNKSKNSASEKIMSDVLFTHLLIILLQVFVFSVIQVVQYTSQHLKTFNHYSVKMGRPGSTRVITRPLPLGI